MIDLVFKLNLPPLTSILKDDSGVLESTRIFEINDAANLVKPEWLFWNDFEWNHAVSFYRTAGDQDRTPIHTDVTVPGQLSWAVNWIHEGHGILEFWRPEQITSKIYSFQKATKGGGSIVPVMTTMQPPYKTYMQPPGVYLTNTHYPHRATGWNSRLAFSLRADKNFTIPWEEVVSRFQNYILF
jgi:hypothetical protein